MTKTMSVICSKVTVDARNGVYYLIANPIKGVNDKGVFKLSKQRFESLAANAGLKPNQLVRNIAGAKLSFDVTLRKAGTAWVNEKTGESGVYGEKNGGKDYYALENYSIEIAANKALNIEMAEAYSDSLSVQMNQLAEFSFANFDKPEPKPETEEQELVNSLNDIVNQDQE